MRLFLIKLGLFLLISISIFSFLSIIFVRKGNGYGTDVISFYYEPKDTLDLIFFGSSHSYCSFDPKVLSENTDLNSYNFATQQQPLWITYHYMIEALKYQQPKYFVLDILMAIYEDDYAEEGVNRDALDKMRLSINKINAINVSVPKPERISYYLNFIKYHNRWKELTKKDFSIIYENKRDNNKGYTSLEYKNYQGKKPNISLITEKKPLSKKNKDYIMKIINLAKSREIELIFVKSPYMVDTESQKIFNTVKEIASDNNIQFIDFNLLYDEIDLDFEKELYDNGHVTQLGSQKVTQYLSSYLNQGAKY